MHFWAASFKFIFQNLLQFFSHAWSPLKQYLGTHMGTHTQNSLYRQINNTMPNEAKSSAGFFCMARNF